MIKTQLALSPDLAVYGRTTKANQKPNHNNNNNNRLIRDNNRLSLPDMRQAPTCMQARNAAQRAGHWAKLCYMGGDQIFVLIVKFELFARSNLIISCDSCPSRVLPPLAAHLLVLALLNAEQQSKSTCTCVLVLCLTQSRNSQTAYCTAHLHTTCRSCSTSTSNETTCGPGTAFLLSSSENSWHSQVNACQNRRECKIQILQVGGFEENPFVDRATGKTPSWWRPSAARREPRMGQCHSQLKQLVPPHVASVSSGWIPPLVGMTASADLRQAFRPTFST